ncbi:MAG: phytanoyl-CoA dioxygenase family protein [Saprospiraceae bacterium]
MRKVFKQESLQVELDKKGYACIPFLSTEEVDTLIKDYFELLPERGGNLLGEETDFATADSITYDFTFIDRSVDYKQKVFDRITEIFMPRISTILEDYKPIIANFIYKKPDGGEVPLHQNWAFVDEEKYTSVSIWCPLVDSNVKNGTLQFVNGSHKRYGKWRGPMVPWELESIKDQIIEKHLTPIDRKAGEAIVLDDSVIHYSNINYTQGLRLAIQLILIPAEAPSIHYHMDPKEDTEKIQMIEVDRNFYMGFNPWMKPKNIKDIKTIKFKKNSLNETEFLKALKGPRFDEKGRDLNLLQKLKKIWM